MKQITQNLKDGATQVAEVPAPGAGRGRLLIRTSHTLVSAGTERMLVEFGRAGLISKARQQPDRVREVLQKARTDGALATYEAVRDKLDQPLPLGYCNVGQVIEVGVGVTGFKVGDRVASNGPHADIVSVPQNLCAHIPDHVSDEQAAFTVLGAIGLQGVRLANPVLGETVIVVGLGLIGLLTVQLLVAQGCRVIGTDFDPRRREMATGFGARAVDPGSEDVVALGHALTGGQGVDAVIITASTSSNDVMAQSAQACRKRGRIVLVGVVGLQLSRADFYEKELTFQVSCSYGPGRYDPAYEQQGQDYPYAFVRWTEQRNFDAVLQLAASGRLALDPLISHRFDIADAAAAFDLLASDTPSLGILLRYEDAPGAAQPLARTIPLGTAVTAASGCNLGFLGAGNYSGRILVPAFKAAGASIGRVVSAGGLSAYQVGTKNGAALASTDSAALLADPAIDAVVIATRHDAHAGQVIAAIEAGKHVFCEKPLCLTFDELDTITDTLVAHPETRLMLGFNRRFSPFVAKMHELLVATRAPKTFVMTVNAGAIPANHWTQDAETGGGRIIGEACHFIDLLRYLAASPIIRHQAVAMADPGQADVPPDTVTITLGFADGAIGTIHYLANGHKSIAKERLEVFCGGRILQLDNFRVLRGWGWRGFSAMKRLRQDKGQTACAQAFVDAVRSGGPSPIPLDEILEVSRVTIAAANDVKA